MRYLIIGLGIYGSNLAIDLTEMGHEVIGADVSSTIVESIKDYISTAYIVDSTDRVALSALPLLNVEQDRIPFNAFEEFQISLDGPDPVIRQVNHTGDSFDRIIGGIQYLQQMKKTITVVTMWTRELRSHLTEYIERLKEKQRLQAAGCPCREVSAKRF